MELITINPSNEPYYSEDFIKGFECGTQRQFEADKADRPRWIPCSECKRRCDRWDNLKTLQE